MRIKKQILHLKIFYIYLMLIVFYFAFMGKVIAGERFEFYNGVRQMGMGGAVVAVVNDETSLISNPAALGKLRQPFLTLVDPEMHANTNITRFATLSNMSEVLSLQGLLDTLERHPGKYYHLRANLFPSFVIPNFGVGLLANWTYNAEVDNSVTNFELKYRNDYALLIGYNFRLFDGIIKLGFNAKYINRAEVDTVLPANSTGLLLEPLVAEGNGIASDAGLIITLPFKLLPSIAGVVRDVGHTKFDAGTGIFYNSINRPQMVKQTYDAGFSITPILGNKSRVQITGEYRDIANVSNEKDIYRRLHAGMEFNFSDSIFLRAGLNQMYWTAGFEFALNNFQFQVASYGEDIGVDDVNRREDRRYIGKFSLRF